MENQKQESSPKSFLIEACVDSVETAIAAQEGGADRVELCANLDNGGTTPSLGCIQLARKLLRISLVILVRPRGGDFYYSDLEFEQMKIEVNQARELGAEGVAIGILNRDGSIDTKRMETLVALAGEMKVVFHRAFDRAADPFRALEDCVDLGVERILSSGQHPKAKEGADLLAELTQEGLGRITIMPGGNINEQNAANIFQKTGAREYHFSALKKVDSEMVFRHPAFLTEKGGAGEYFKTVGDSEKIRAVRAALEGAV